VADHAGDDVAGAVLAVGQRRNGDSLGVDSAAVGQHLHRVADEVVGEDVVVGVVRGGGLLYLVRPAAPTHRDGRVRGVVDLVVRDRGVLAVPDVDGDPAVVLHRQPVQVVVDDLVAAGVVGGGGR